MPTTKKSAAKSSGGKTTGAKKAAAKRKESAAAKKRQQALVRGCWAGAYLFLAFVGALSIFNVKGFFIDWYKWLVASLFGFGYYVTPVVFLACGIILFIKLHGRARLRVVAAMCMPLILGAIFHIVRDTTPYTFGLEGIKLLCQSGRALTSGGLLAGSLGIFLETALSAAGGIALCFLLGLVSVLITFNTSPKRILNGMRPAPEPEEDPLPPPRLEKNPIKGKAQPTPEILPEKSRRDIFPPEPTPPIVTVAEPAQKKDSSSPFDALASIFKTDKLPDVSDFTDPTAPLTPGFVSSAAVVAEPAPVPAPSVAPPAPVVEPEPEQPEEEPFDQTQLEELLNKSLEEDEPAKYIYPPLSLLKSGDGAGSFDQDEVKRFSDKLTDTLLSFGIEAAVINVTRGPTVTRYELQLQRGVKFAKVTSLADDIALAFGASGVRIAPVPNSNSVGIEMPNEAQYIVTLRDILENKAFTASPSKLTFAVGKDIAAKPVVGDIQKMPHMLIAGTTGSGKSVCINSILISLIYKSTPQEVRLIMVDPKMIELGVYNGLPHLLIPVVTDPKKAAGALNWAVGEMMRRYKLLSELGVRDLASYNAEIVRRGEGETLPNIVIVIDELADLMFVAAHEVEEAIVRLAQMARAAGMHLIIATQRPSADVITGIMKANIPSRIAFAVASQIESRIILDQMGAEKLIGRGDMLYNPLGAGKPLRVQGCFISSPEVEQVIDFVKKTGTPDYSEEVLEHIERQAENDGKGASAGGSSPSGGGGLDDDDSLLPAAIDIIVEGGQASVSMLQRRLKLGYSRAARLIDIMEERGIVGPFEGSKPRSVLITSDQWKEMKLRQTY